MGNEFDEICLDLHRNLKDEKPIDESLRNLDELNKLINKSSTTKLANNLHILMPTILQVIDNFDLKIQGIQLIDKLIQKLDHQSFVKQGYDNLILFTLKNQFYQQDLELFKFLFTICQNAFIKFNFKAVNSTKPVTELDEIVDIVLNLIEIGTDEQIRLNCLQQFPKLLLLLDKSVYKHLNRLIDDFIYIVDPNFLTARPKQIQAFLIILNQLISLTDEKFYPSRPLIVLIKLLFCIHELKELKDNCNAEEIHSIHIETLNCLKSIHKLNSTKFKFFLNELEQNEELKILYNQIQDDLTLLDF